MRSIRVETKQKLSLAKKLGIGDPVCFLVGSKLSCDLNHLCTVRSVRQLEYCHTHPAMPLDEKLARARHSWQQPDVVAQTNNAITSYIMLLTQSVHS